MRDKFPYIFTTSSHKMCIGAIGNKFEGNFLVLSIFIKEI